MAKIIFRDTGVLKQFLVGAKIQTTNNSLYQTVDGIIGSLKEIQDLLLTEGNPLNGLSRILTYGTEAERLAFQPDLLPGVLIIFYVTDTNTLWGVVDGSWTVLAASAFATYLTSADESATLPNSLQVLAGTGITFDDTVPNQRTINADATASLPHPFLTMGA